MIFLLLVMGGSAYLAARRIHSRRANPTALALAITNPPLSPQPWGRLDDMQLTRLLRQAAEDK